MRCAYCGASRARFQAEEHFFCDVICHMKWLGDYPRADTKPSSCTLRRSKPRGPFKICEGTCQAFEICVEYSRLEKAEEERAERALERLRRL